MNAEDLTQLPIADLLPHRAPMILLDRVLLCGPGFLEAEVSVRAESLFVNDGRVPAWVGVEYMAQTCACFAGMEARGRGELARVGFLLGTRDYRTRVVGFEVGASLRVRARPVHREDGGLSVVECQIWRAERELPIVQATLTVYEVADLGAYLEQYGGGR
jgi:predicted hotdog family 3-hydroxylacyl-ACP dehydratase